MSILVGVTMISAFYRLWLYEQAYGFTVLRFYSHTFIIYLAVIFTILIFKVIFEQSQNIFLYRSFLATVSLFVTWNVVNPHRLIAAVNVDRQSQGARRLDIYYLSQLSDDAIPAAAKALQLPLDFETRGRLLKMFSDRQSYINGKIINRSWPSYHWGTARALNLLAEIQSGTHNITLHKEL